MANTRTIRQAAKGAGRGRSSAGSAAPGRLAPGLCVLAILVALLAAYANSFQGRFVFDDGHAIVENEGIRTLWPPGGWLDANSRPVANFTFALNYALHGYDPWGWHAVNLAIHAGAALCLFALLRRAFGDERGPKWLRRSATWAAGAAALLWAVHPLQTQSVTYIVQRMESLAGLCYVATILLIVRGADAERRRWAWYAGAIVVCALGMGVKETMATAPIVAIAFDRIFLARSWRVLVRRRGWVYLGLCLTWSVMVGAHLASGDPSESAGFGYREITPLRYLLSQPAVLLHYLRLAVWPHPLQVDYMWRGITWVKQAVAPGAVVLALLGVTVWGLWRRPRLAFAGLWFFVILGPTSSFMPIADLAMEHRMYLPLAAPLALAVVGAVWGLRVALPGRDGLRGVVGVGAVVAVALTFIILTRHRNTDYHDVEGFWRDVVAKAPHNHRGWKNLGVELMRRGRIGESAKAYRRAIDAKPDYAPARRGYGKTLAALGRYRDALDQFARAEEDGVLDAASHNNIAWIRATAADPELRDPAIALAHSKRALAMTPSPAPGILDTHAAALAAAGRFGEAVDTAGKALDLARRQADAGLADRIRGRMALYREGEGYVENRRTLNRTNDE
jgi:tetratricopeptide (TPR) repeat protein